MKPGDVTQLLRAWGEGDEGALEKLIPIVYAELQRLAHSYMRKEHPGHTLETTALVHETYVRLAGGALEFRDRVHFYAACAQLMRRVLVDYARSRGYLKRGGGIKLVALAEAPEMGHDGQVDLVALDEALSSLATLDPRKSQVIELRFFGGLTVEETAAALHVSRDTVMRDWKVAKAWLMRELDTEKPRVS